MKPIKITDRKSVVNGRATAHTYTRARDIVALSERAEKALEKFGLVKSERQGARYVDQSGERLPKAYGHKTRGTTVTLERRSGAWFLVNAGGYDLYPGNEPRAHMHVTQEQADAACRRLLSTVAVMKSASTVEPVEAVEAVL
jgi:hypothetical protein